MSERKWSDAEFRPRIGVVGAGAVGCYYAGKLAELGCEVHFLMRSDYEHVARHGLRIESDEGNLALKTVRVYNSPEMIGPVDLVFVAIKSTANDALPQLIAPLLGDDTAILTVQNGLGNDEFLAGHFGAERLMGGLCFICLNRISPGVIRHFGHGKITLGEFQRAPGDRVGKMAALFNSAGVKCEAVSDLALEQWRKLVWNIPFNGLSIAANATVADVLASPGLAKLARDLMLETIAAAGALGFAIEESFADFQIDRSRTMGPYKPSSMIDYLAGNAVEVQAIWQDPLERGINAGASLPRLEMLTALLGRLCKIV